MIQVLVGALLLVALLVALLPTNKPVHDIAGCYEARNELSIDHLCLAPSGVYQQLFALAEAAGPADKYNEASWRSFFYARRHDTFTAVVLYDFVRKGARGEVEEIAEIDIQPYKDMFGVATFQINGKSDANGFRDRRADRIYRRTGE